MAADPYEQLAELAERELALVCAYDPERLDELDALIRERAALVAALPSHPPAAARAPLARAAALQERTTAALATLRAEVGRSLGDVDRGRRTARGYGMALPTRPSLDRAG